MDIFLLENVTNQHRVCKKLKSVLFLTRSWCGTSVSSSKLFTLKRTSFRKDDKNQRWPKTLNKKESDELLLIFFIHNRYIYGVWFTTVHHSGRFPSMKSCELSDLWTLPIVSQQDVLSLESCKFFHSTPTLPPKLKIMTSSMHAAQSSFFIRISYKKVFCWWRRNSLQE